MRNSGKGIRIWIGIGTVDRDVGLRIMDRGDVRRVVCIFFWPVDVSRHAIRNKWSYAYFFL